MEIERFRKSQAKEMRKYRAKQRKRMERNREVLDGKSATVASEEQYKLLASQGYTWKQTKKFVLREPDTNKHWTVVHIESNRVDPRQCKGEDKLSPLFPFYENNANPERKYSNDHGTETHILHSEVPATDIQFGQQVTMTPSMWSMTQPIQENEMSHFINSVTPSTKPKMTLL